jgi:hypothetical protein
VSIYGYAHVSTDGQTLDAHVIRPLWSGPS